MRKNIKLPRILKVNWIQDLKISVAFNNGESRIIDFKKVLEQIGTDENSPQAILYDQNEFEKVQIDNNTLSWKNVEQFISTKNNSKIKVPFEIGADVLLKYSTPEKEDVILKIGRLIREARKKSGLTQQDLAIKSGTSRSYISRIENDKSDVELSTLRKIIELGLGRNLEIRIK